MYQALPCGGDKQRGARQEKMPRLSEGANRQSRKGCICHRSLWMRSMPDESALRIRDTCQEKEIKRQGHRVIIESITSILKGS